MKFKKVFRGYAPKQVDDYIIQQNNEHQQIYADQKQLIDQLKEENSTLKGQVQKYQQDSQAIAQSLVASQKLADELKNDAVKFSELVLTRAKVFYATWQVYSQTLVATLDEEELATFNSLMKKVEEIINAYEGKNVNEQAQQVVAQVTQQNNTQTNPINKVEQAAGVVIDLDEIKTANVSLEEVCRELGLIQ